jgi:prephenate dehydratase
MKVAFQGEHGAYSESAIFEHFPGRLETAPMTTFEEVFTCVADGSCECGFVPIENSLAGSIHRNYDLLLQHQLSVIGEHNLRVSHCLIGKPGATMAGVKKVISHPQALAQCDAYLRALSGVHFEPVYDTAGSVKIVREQDDLGVAAIASRRAADIYGMKILAESIEDNPNNYTRFLIISRQPPVIPGADAKTSVVFALKNRPGVLFKALSVFALRDIDLTKIESRPLVGKVWEYFFYIDLVGSTDDQNVRNALTNLGEYATFLRVLGSYPRFRGL